ncbi:developmental pluripotency-associated protein 4 [Carlito syrichta]|uniref:Developmental pluripotency-associated protein 4 n=1 Tax=Carlito syrichta TaxID=1868482 RepID=A0A1U7TBY4_CARSF|nr:developmental pluripotency-associated protein 4 [Carlito syrichta]
MENARTKERNSTESSKENCGNPKYEQVSEAEEDQRASDSPGTSALPGTSAKGTKRKTLARDDKVLCPKKAECSDNPKPRKKPPIPPLPSKLPPVTLLHRDIVRAWCQQLKLSSKGQKLDAYKRLCAYAYPHQKDIPCTPKEARIQTKKLKANKREADLSEVASPREAGLSAPEEAATLLEGVNKVVVTTSAPEAMLASWTRIAASAQTLEAVESPQETYGVRWCVVHGTSLPADTEGWVHLQFHAGQAWVPEKQGGRVSALFLLPACNFPPPHLEDNMLCPRCVHRNKILIKSLQWE